VVDQSPLDSLFVRVADFELTFSVYVDIVLGIASGLDIDEDLSPYVHRLLLLKRQEAEFLAFLKLAKELEKTLEQRLFPVAPFVVRSSIGRQKRQMMLNRLTSQHCVCLLQRGDGNKSVGEMKQELMENVTVQELAKEKALQQEEAIFKTCSSNQTYQSKTMNLNAIDWYRSIRVETDKAENVTKREVTMVPPPGMTTTKRKASTSILLDSDIDWDHGRGDSDYKQFKTRKRIRHAVIDELEESLPNNIAPEIKIELVQDILSDAEKQIQSGEKANSDERIRLLIRPIVRKATERHRLSQSIYYTQ
jgi:hypothetical protein